MQQRETEVHRAACRYWQRRGLPTEPGQVVTAPGDRLLLLSLLGAAGGDVVLPRPCADWYAPQARLLGRTRHPVPIPAESGGLPDPFALLEVVRRARGEGGDPRTLLVSVADDPTGTAPPPELLHEVCEAAAGQGLLVISDESWRDTFHDPHDTVTVSPAEVLPEPAAVPVIVLLGLNAALLPPALPAAVARFSADDRGRALADAVRGVLRALRTQLAPPSAAAAAEALAEPAAHRARRAESARVHAALGTALCRIVSEAGALCRPPHAGRQLYADLEPLRPALAAHGVVGAAALEAELVRRLGPCVTGGHRFGDDPQALRVRFATDLLAADRPPPAGSPDAAACGGPVDGGGAVDGGDPLERPRVAEALASVQSCLSELAAGSGHPSG